MFMAQLDVDEQVALRFSCRKASPPSRKIAYVPAAELVAIEEFEEVHRR